MQVTCKTTIAILGAIVLGTAFVSSASAQCGNSPVSHVAPSGWGQTNPSAGRGQLVAASYSPDVMRVSDGDADDEPIVGMWHATFTAVGNVGIPDGAPIDNALLVLHSDNTEIMNSSRPPQDGNVCMGVWARTGRSKYRVNHIAWGGNDTANAPGGIGNPGGPTRIVEDLVLSPDGKHFTGTFTLEAFDTSGNVIAHITGVIAATRITVNTTVPDLL